VKNITKTQALGSSEISLLDSICMKVTEWNLRLVWKQDEDSTYNILWKVQNVEYSDWHWSEVVCHWLSRIDGTEFLVWCIHAKKLRALQ